MIQVKDLAYSYRQNRDVLKDIAFDAPKGLCTAILGNNGAGKSTLIKCLNRILEPVHGVVYVDGKDIRQSKRNDIAKSMAYVAQHSTGDRFTVYDTILLGRKPYIRFEPNREDHRIVESVIKDMNIGNLALRYTCELSGGERQKVMLAMALAQQPKVLLLDEPTGNLDLGSQFEVLSLVRRIAIKENISIIIVIHDLNLALRHCDKFLFLKDNHIFAYGGMEIMTPENILEVYGVPVTIVTIDGIPVMIPYPGI